MVSFNEFAKIVELIKNNQATVPEQVVYEHENWHSADAETFSKVDQDGEIFEIFKQHDDFQLQYLGKADDPWANPDLPLPSVDTGIADLAFHNDDDLVGIPR